MVIHKYLMFSFKEWFSHYSEVFDSIRTAPTDDVKFDFDPPEEFDDQVAREKCQRSVSYHEIASNLDWYDDPADDPNFKSFDFEAWKTENPKPRRSRYDSDEEYQEDFATWQGEYQEVSDERDQDVAMWREKMRKLKVKVDEAYEEALDTCVEGKRKEFEKNNDESESPHGSHEHKFTSGGDDFFVTIKKLSIGNSAEVSKVFEVKNKSQQEQLNSVIGDIYDVTLTGPKSYNSTNKNTGMTEVYNKLLTAIKAFMQSHDVCGLHFLPYEPGMAMIYDRFMKMFLGNKFVPVDAELFLRKDVIKKLSDSGMLTGTKREFGQVIKSGKDNYDTGLEYYRRARLFEKNARLLLPKMVGLVVTKTETGEPFVVARTEVENGRTYLVCVGIGRRNFSKMLPERIGPVDDRTTDTFVKTAVSNDSLANFLTANNIPPEEMRSYTGFLPKL